jgi:hypothetical protein
MTFKHVRTLECGRAISRAAVATCPSAVACAVARPICGNLGLAVAAAEVLAVFCCGADRSLALEALPAWVTDTELRATIRCRHALSICPTLALRGLTAQTTESVLALALTLAIRLHRFALILAATNHSRDVKRSSISELLDNGDTIAAVSIPWQRICNLELHIELRRGHRDALRLADK